MQPFARLQVCISLEWNIWFLHKTATFTHAHDLSLPWHLQGGGHPQEGTLIHVHTTYNGLMLWAMNYKCSLRIYKYSTPVDRTYLTTIYIYIHTKHAIPSYYSNFILQSLHFAMTGVIVWFHFVWGREVTKIIEEEKRGRGGQEGRMKREEVKSKIYNRPRLSSYYHSTLSAGHTQ